MRAKQATTAAPPWRCARCLRCPPYVRRQGLRPTCLRCAEELTARGRKWCRVCAQALPLESFAAAGRTGDRRRGTCRTCHAAARRATATASTRRWRERNRERQRAMARSYRAANPDRRRAWDQRYLARKKLRILRGEVPHA